MYPSVVKVLPKDDFRIAVEFDNGEKGELDMTPFLQFGVFQRLQSQDEFSRVHVAFDTIAWESGVDLDPEFVYDKCELKTIAQQTHPADAPKARAADA